MKKQNGFTLLEVMLVLFLMGLAAAYVSYNGFSNNQADKLKEQAQRLQVIFDMASDYAILNQRQLGLRIEEKERTYAFMILDDDENWQLLDDNKLFATHELPQEFKMELNLDSLPWEEELSLFDEELFDERLSLDDDAVNIGNEEDKELPPPQIFILSSGDITPFDLAFIFEDNFNDDLPAYFSLQGKYTTPLVLINPEETL